MGRRSRQERSRSPADARGSTRERQAPLFDVLRDAATAGDEALGLPAVASDPPLVRFDRGVLLRAVNALKSARLLLDEAHWEFATGPARQLFELVVNLEFLNASENREQEALRFAKFGLLQTVRAQLTTITYARETGRQADEQRITDLERMLEVGYDEFRTRRGGFVKSWSGRSTRELAELSSQQPLRTAQYLQLFVAWSEQIHAAPVSLLDGVFPRHTIEQVIAQDDIRVAEIAAMCVVLYTDLWRQLLTLPSLDEERVARWQRTLMTEARRRQSSSA